MKSGKGQPAALSESVALIYKLPLKIFAKTNITDVRNQIVESAGGT